jgi:hypothetical protein
VHRDGDIRAVEAAWIRYELAKAGQWVERGEPSTGRIARTVPVGG